MYKQIDSSSANLAGYWRFNENTGLIAFDETSNRDVLYKFNYFSKF